MDHFLAAKNCDRCNKPLDGTRIMSMFNEDVLCLDCKCEERKFSNYEEARTARLAAAKTGNRNFKRIGP